MTWLIRRRHKKIIRRAFRILGNGVGIGIIIRNNMKIFENFGPAGGGAGKAHTRGHVCGARGTSCSEGWCLAVLVLRVCGVFEI